MHLMVLKPFQSHELLPDDYHISIIQNQLITRENVFFSINRK